MSPQCPSCGQETMFIPQYQQWYCPRCQRYPFQPAVPMFFTAQQYYVPPVQTPLPAQPPFAGPTVQSASLKINTSFMERQGTDRFISSSWVWVIVMFQMVFPVSAVLALYLILVDETVEITDTGILMIMIIAILLVSIALAISHAVVIYWLVERRDRHFWRDRRLMEGMIDYLGAISLNTHIDLNVERWTMNTLHLGSPNQDRSATLWALLVALIAIIPFIGIIFLVYSMMFLTKDVHEHDSQQRTLNAQFQQGLLKAGKISAPSQNWQPLPKRDTAAYIVLTILTLGLFLPYWWYVNIVDMNTHMKNQWEFENTLIAMLQAEG